MSNICVYCQNHGYPCLNCYRNSPGLFTLANGQTIYAIQKKDLEIIWNNWRINNLDKIVYIFENNIKNILGKWNCNNIYPYNISELSEIEKNIIKNCI